MDGSFPSSSEFAFADLAPAVSRILDIQDPSGAIPWFEHGPWDPWNHTESAMALTVAGETEAASRAFDFLTQTQRPDGAWLGEYGNALPMVDRDYISREKAPAVLDTNFCAYPAVGIAHFLKATEQTDHVMAWWPMVERALDFVISLQRSDGTIPWSLESIGTVDEDALLAGNASIAKSLECGLFLARELGQSKPLWHTSRDQLLKALRHHPERFDRRKTGSRFAMDWYYPVLSGALQIELSQQRIDEKWDVFVAPDRGCRCVADEPWVTVAETAELVLALISANQKTKAGDLFKTVFEMRDQTGVFWMGHQFEENIYWPRERPSWTQAAVILSADGLFGKTKAGTLLTGPVLKRDAAAAGS